MISRCNAGQSSMNWLDGLAHIRFRVLIRGLADGKFLLQALVDTSEGKLSRYPDTVIDGAIIRRAMIHDAYSANSQERRTSVLGVVQTLFEVVECFTRKQRADLRSDRGIQRLAQQITHQACQPFGRF